MKETKNGLIVGLAFIVLFGVLLANSGNPTGAQPGDFNRVEESILASNPQNNGHAESMKSDAGIIPVPVRDSQDNTSNTIFDSGHFEDQTDTTADGMAMNVDGLPRIRLDGASRRMESDAGRSSLQGTMDDGIRDNGETGRRGDAADRADGIIVPPIHNELADGSKSREGSTDDIRNMLTPDNADTKRQADGRDDDKSAIKSVAYEIKKGDSLAKITRKWYGSESPSLIQAVCDANPDVIKDKNSIRLGAEIAIPVLPGFEDKFASVKGRKSSQQTTPRVPQPEDKKVEPQTPVRNETDVAVKPDDTQYRTYEVKDKDSLSRIAKRELGDAGRFNEIFELNRDQLKTPDMVRKGMILKLPSKKTIRTVTTRTA